jgi:glycosyltransferase involved in cell wall biosynthesis
VKKEVPDVRLLVVGPTLDLNIDGVEVKNLVTDREELSRYFKQASVFVMPSFYEPFGIVFAEAFAYKNPCIGTNICAMPEIIEEGKGGFLVAPGDYVALAERIIMLLKDKALACEMGEYGYRKVRDIYNWDIVVRKMIEEMNKI